MGIRTYKRLQAFTRTHALRGREFPVESRVRSFYCLALAWCGLWASRRLSVHDSIRLQRGWGRPKGTSQSTTAEGDLWFQIHPYIIPGVTHERPCLEPQGTPGRGCIGKRLRRNLADSVWSRGAASPSASKHLQTLRSASMNHIALYVPFQGRYFLSAGSNQFPLQSVLGNKC